MAWPTRTLALIALMTGVAAVAQPPKDELTPKQEANRDKFQRFQRELLGLAQRLEASDKPGERDRAKVMRKALELIGRENVQGQFQKLLDGVKDGVQPAELQGLGVDNAQLTQALREILELMMSDDGSARNKDEQKRIEELLKDARAIERAQRQIRATTESKRADPKQIAEEQEKTTKRTEELAKKMAKGDKKDAKPGEQKDAKPKGGEPKPGDPKDRKPKDGDPKDGKAQDGKPKDGKPSDAKPQDGKPGEPKPGETPPGPQQPQTPGRKQIEAAVPEQKKAEDALNKPDRKGAAKAEDKAIQAIEEAIKELEKRLKQLREEEAQKLLANLEVRCKKLLQMQTEVYEATKAIDSEVVKAKGQKSNADIQKSQQQADKEREIVAEADKALKLMESEGTAVAFARVLQEVAVDMRAVERRLGESAVGRDTQLIEENIIALLQEMVAALKKAQEDLKKPQPQSGPGGQAGKGADQRLIDQLAELRLIKALQMQVNARTRLQSARYQGEQASDPLVRRELDELSARQEKLHDMVGKLERGENR